MATQLREAPELPELPEMGSVKPMPMQGRGAVPMQGGQGGGFAQQSLGRQLRRVMGMLTGGGIILAAFLVFWQFVAAPGKGPAELLAYFESKFEIGVLNGKMGVPLGGPQMTQADYDRAISQAQREGAAKVEYDLQAKIAVLQADQQRVVQAYGALYQRTNAIAQAGLQIEANLQQAKQQVMAATEAGKTTWAAGADIFCKLDVREACDAASATREEIKKDMESTRGDLGSRINELMAGVPDAASLVAGADIASKGLPSLPEAAGDTGL